MPARSTPTIIWYCPHLNEEGSNLQKRQEELRAAGFFVQAQTQVCDFYAAALQAIAKSNSIVPPIFMVSGVCTDSLAAIARLRMYSVLLPVMVSFTEFNEEQVLHALYSGADDYCTLGTGVALWVAKIECLLRRMRHSEKGALPLAQTTPQPVSQPAISTEAVWRLADEGWVLISPAGIRIALTTTERELLLALCTNPERRASHQQLLQAISEHNEGDEALGHNRLGVVISRLKRKATSEGVTLPIRSIYKWGYTFGAPILSE